MAIASPYEQYKTTTILTCSPVERVILLYKRSIELLDKSIEEFDAENFLEFSENIKKACKIIEYLLSVLDMEKGGEIAKNLSDIYDFSLFTLTASNTGKNKDGVLRVRHILVGLLEAWEAIREYEQNRVNG
ncbi:MAG: flagellar export chaperone FliS [bacterium]|nr:flagellar export chaperone FliS [bacterium]